MFWFKENLNCRKHFNSVSALVFMKLAYRIRGRVNATQDFALIENKLIPKHSNQLTNLYPAKHLV